MENRNRMFAIGKGERTKKRVNVSVNRDAKFGRGYSHGMTNMGVLYRRPTANDLNGFQSVTITHDKPSAELIARANKNCNKFRF